MTRTANLVIFILISVNIGLAQNIYDVTSRVRVSEIKNEKLRKAFMNFQKRSFLDLPINYDASFFRFDDYIPMPEQVTKKKETMPCTYNDSNTPFYANIDRRDKTRNDKETCITLIKEINGDYIWGIVDAISPLHDISKAWLVTFSFSGEMIDYLPIGESPGMMARTIEAEINKDFTIDVQRLDFSDYDCIIRHDSLSCKFIDNLKGQRIDTKYEVTPEGKFKKLEEIRYQPQIYTPEILLESYKSLSGMDYKIFIRQRKEKRLE